MLPMAGHSEEMTKDFKIKRERKEREGVLSQIGQYLLQYRFQGHINPLKKKK
jgi:hypothetical protein